MANTPRTTQSAIVAAGHESLLATKLHVPRPLPDFVPRPRLPVLLESGLTRGVILVCAPAGFGKTAMLADWCRRGRRPVAWLSLDAGDNDPSRFWRHAAAALDRVRPGIAERVAPLLGQPAPASLDGLVTALVNELAAQSDEDEVVVVLEDYHLIETQPVHASLTFLIEHLPPGLRLVLTSRADPPLPLARLRARGQLTELRADELRFTVEEAAALLREAVGHDQSAVETLTSRAEGWAVGLQLAALSLRGRPDVAGFVENFSGSHRYVLDYLTEEVLERQPDEVRGFLLETSVLERLSGELCDAVTGRHDGQRMLEAIERANLFLVPLDDVRGWWRYHALFADLLRARLQQERPQRAAELHRNAAAWCDQHGLADDALRYAFAAGDAAEAARLLERHADALLMRSEGATVQRWLAALPAELADSRPRLLLAQTRVALLGGRVEAVDRLLDAAKSAPADIVDEPYEPSAGSAASLLSNIPATIALDRTYLAELRGDAEGALAFLKRAMAEIREDEWMLESHARGYLGVAEWLRGRLGDAERALSSSIAHWRAAGERYPAVRGWYHLGQVQRARGRLDAAVETYRLALEIATVPGRPPLPGAGIAHVGMAEVAYQRDELAAALQHATEGVALCRQLAYTQPLVTGLATLAWIRQVTGDATGALDAMTEAERIAPGSEVVDLLDPVPALRARLLMARGDVDAAARWTEKRGLGADDEPSYSIEPAYLVLVRVLLSQGLPDRALGLLERLHALAVAQQRTGSLIEIQALKSLALAAGGQEDGAVAAQAEALMLAHTEGYIRVFTDEGKPMGALLGRLVAVQGADQTAARRVPPDYVGRLARGFERDVAVAGSRTGPSAAPVPGLVEPPSERELEVLHLLAAGKPNRAIADELYVALDTVKKHVTHILDKLGAANRTEAVARARQSGLLP